MAEGLVQSLNQNHRLNRDSIFTFTPSQELGIDDVRKAFQLFTVPNVQAPLAEIIKMAQEWADQLANIPLLMQGITGASPETPGWYGRCWRRTRPARCWTSPRSTTRCSAR